MWAEDGRSDPVGWASMTFAILPGRAAAPRPDMSSELPVRWSLDGVGLDGPVRRCPRHIAWTTPDGGSPPFPFGNTSATRSAPCRGV